MCPESMKEGLEGKSGESGEAQDMKLDARQALWHAYILWMIVPLCL